MNHTQTYKVRGMHCASCAGVIEKTLKKVVGVESVSANYGTEAVAIIFDETRTTSEDLSKKIEPLGYSLIIRSARQAEPAGLDQSKKEKLAEIADMRRMVISVMPLALFSVFVMGWVFSFSSAQCRLFRTSGKNFFIIFCRF